MAEIEKAASLNDNDIKRAFGKNLAMLRKAKGMSRADLAEFLELSPLTVRSYENGLRQPTFETLFRLAEFFYISLDELLGHCDSSQEEQYIENFRLKQAAQILSTVGTLMHADSTGYALFIKRQNATFKKDSAGNVSMVDDGKDAIFFSGAHDVIDFAESIQKAAALSDKTFKQVFFDKAENLFTDAESVKRGQEILKSVTGQWEITRHFKIDRLPE